MEEGRENGGGKERWRRKEEVTRIAFFCVLCVSLSHFERGRLAIIDADRSWHIVTLRCSGTATVVGIGGSQGPIGMKECESGVAAGLLEQPAQSDFFVVYSAGDGGIRRLRLPAIPGILTHPSLT